MASALAEKRAIGNSESAERTVSSTTTVVYQRPIDLTSTPGERMASALAEKRAVGSDEPVATRDATVIIAEDAPDSSSAPALAPTKLVRAQHYPRPGAYQVNPLHTATSGYGDDDDEESLYRVHNTSEPTIPDQHNYTREAIALDVTLAPENDRADSRETHGEIGRAKPISEVNCFAQPKVQIGIFVIVLVIGVVVGLSLGLRNGGDGEINFTLSPTASPTTVAPSTVPSAAPSAAPSMFAIERFQQEILPEYSQVAIQDTNSPQSKAFNWLTNNTELESYENPQRLRRFFLDG
jgi:hypothetical protein